MRTLGVAALAIAALAGHAGAARAQAPAERVALTRLRDSISFSHDTTAILRLERVMIERARAERDDPMHHLHPPPRQRGELVVAEAPLATVK